MNWRFNVPATDSPLTAADTSMKLYLKALAPYAAVVTFWIVWPNAWLAILTYHVQILLWNRRSLRIMRPPKTRQDLLFALPAVLAGPVLYLLLPLITQTDISAWLATYHLSGPSLVLMIPYFGLVHPVLEQIHWHPLRERSAWFHAVFAGYHMIVLSALLTRPWIFLCLVVLAGTSLAWKLLYHKCQGLTVPVLSHVLADAGVIVAAWAST